jgi:putative SOS response-associated peptidase YedK
MKPWTKRRHRARNRYALDMCGRFAQSTPAKTLVDLFSLGAGLRLRPRFNLAPTQAIAIIRADNGNPSLHHHRWGLVPPWAPSLKFGAKMINARAETVFDKPAFAFSARNRRCIIPASGFYEWTTGPSGKEPWLFSPPKPDIFCFAGLWSVWAATDGAVTYTATILTTTANETMTPFHHRMPVILDKAGSSQWLDHRCTQAAMLRPLLVPTPQSTIIHTRVSTRVNKVANDDAACMAPV